MRKALVAPALLAWVFLGTASAQKVSDDQKLAMYAKPSVVRILSGYIAEFDFQDENKNAKRYTVPLVGSGSGSIINPNGYIITNAHVTEPSHMPEEKAKEAVFVQYVKMLCEANNKDFEVVKNDEQLIKFIVNSSKLLSWKHIHHVITPDGTAFPFEIKAFGAPVGEGKDVSVIKIELKNAPIVHLGDSDKVQLQDNIMVLGYPGAADTSLLDSKSAFEATVTNGKISAKKNTTDGAPVLQVSAAATHGNSGGPVFNDKGEVIGMLTFRGDTVNGQEVQGFSFIVPSNSMMEFIKQAGTTNEEGLVDQRYREGLDLFWQGYYTPAITKFDEVRRLYPQHSETERLIQQSQQAISEGKEKSDIGKWLIIGGAAGGGVLVIVVVVVVVVKSRKKSRFADAQAAYGGGPAYPGPQPAPHQQHPMPQPGYGPAPPQQHQPITPQQQHFPAPPPMPLVDAGQLDAVERTIVVGAALPPKLGAIMFTSGPLSGKKFDIPQEGLYIGRDGAFAQVVISDNRVSKRHVWVGVRDGRVVVADQKSTNGTFVNSTGGQPIQEVSPNPGDVVILSKADVARFVYQK